MAPIETVDVDASTLSYEICNLDRGVDYAVRVRPNFDGVAAQASPALVTQTARAPEAPYIKVVVPAVDERRQAVFSLKSKLLSRESLSRSLRKLERSESSDRSHSKAHAHTDDASVVAKKMMVLERDIGLLLRQLHSQHSKAFPVDVRWEMPADDGDATVLGFVVFVDGKIVKQLPPFQTHISLDVVLGEGDRSVYVVATSNHPVGSSPESNTVVLSSKLFEPYVHRCRLSVHRRDAAYPQSGCCAYIDTFSADVQGSAAFPASYQRSPRMSRRQAAAQQPPEPTVSALKPGSTVPSIQSCDVRSGQSVELFAPCTLVVLWTHWCKASCKFLPVFYGLASRVKALGLDFRVVAFTEGRSAAEVQETVQALQPGWDQSVLQHTFGDEAMSEDVMQQLGTTHVPELWLTTRKGLVSWHGLPHFETIADLEAEILHKINKILGNACMANCRPCADKAKKTAQNKRALANPYGSIQVLAPQPSGKALKKPRGKKKDGKR